MPSFAEKAKDLAARAETNSAWRQKDCFNLIPSESTPSLLVKMCEIADPAGRYAEHRSMKGDEVYFYQGTDFIRDVEIECQKELAAFFGCSDIELRPISGQMANEVVFKGLVKFVNRGRAEGQLSRRIRLVLNNELIYGGHLSAQPMGALFNLRRGRPGDRQGAGRQLPRPQGQPLQARPRAAGRDPRVPQARAHHLRQEHVPLPGAGQVRGRHRPRLEGAAGPDVRHGPRPRPLRRLPGPLRGGRGHRHRQHPQDLLRDAARRRRRQHPEGLAAPAALGRDQGPGLPRLDEQPPSRDAPRPAHGLVRDERLQGALPEAGPGQRQGPGQGPPRPRHPGRRRPGRRVHRDPPGHHPGQEPSGPAWRSPGASRRTTS